MNACPVVTIQPSSAVTESPNSILVRRKAYPPSLFNGPTKDCQVNRPPRRIEELLPVKGSPPIRPLTICVSPDSFLGLERWEAHGVCHLPAGRLLGMVTSIWCRDRLPAMHSSNGPLFHAGSPTKTPSSPTQDRLQHHERFRPRSSPSHEHGFGIPSRGEPNQLAPRPYQPTWKCSD